MELGKAEGDSGLLEGAQMPVPSKDEAQFTDGIQSKRKWDDVEAEIINIEDPKIEKDGEEQPNESQVKSEEAALSIKNENGEHLDESQVKLEDVTLPFAMRESSEQETSAGVVQEEDENQYSSGIASSSNSLKKESAFDLSDPDSKWNHDSATMDDSRSNSVELRGLANDAEEEWDDNDFVFISQATRKLSVTDNAFARRPQAPAMPSAPPLYLIEEIGAYTNPYSSALAGGGKAALNPTNDELFRILAEYEGSQTMLEACLAQIKSTRESISNLDEVAWKLDLRMLIAEENGDIREVPFENNQSWGRRVVNTLKSTLLATGTADPVESGEGILVASLLNGVVKEKETHKTQLRQTVNDLIDRALVASIKRHLAIEHIRRSLSDREALRVICDALMHYENRDRDVCVVSKSIRQLLSWVLGCLFDAEVSEIERITSQIWLIRRAKMYGLKNPPRALSRVSESLDAKGTTVQWANNDWIDRWMVILQAIIEKDANEGLVSLVRSASVVRDPNDLSATMFMQVDQDEEVLLALLVNFPFDQGMTRLFSPESADVERCMSRVWHLEEILGEACSQTRSSCPRFSAELAIRLCQLLNRATNLLEKGAPQSFLDRLVVRAGIFLMNRASVIDITRALSHISTTAAWAVLCTTMEFARGEEYPLNDWLVSGEGIVADVDDELYRDLVDFKVDAAPKQHIRARNLTEWMAQAPSVRGHFYRTDNHLARCDFLASLAVAKGGTIAGAVVRELLGLAYFMKAVPCEVVNPLVCKISKAHPQMLSLVLHLVALNDSVFFSRTDNAVAGLFTEPCKGWEPTGERDIRFFRDWLSRDPSDPRALIACDLLERLDTAELSFDTARSLARMMAIVSVTDAATDVESSSVIYQKTILAFRRSRLIERFWTLVLRLGLDNPHRSPEESPKSRRSEQDETVDASDIEFLQLTLRRNPTQPFLAFVVGMATLDSECLVSLVASGRTEATWQLARVMLRDVVTNLPMEDSEGFAVGVRESRIEALRICMRLDPEKFVENVVLKELDVRSKQNRTQFLLACLEIANDDDVTFVDLVLRRMDTFDIPRSYYSRFQKAATLATPRLMMQLLINRTSEELGIWFGLGLVLVEQSGIIPAAELFENADKVLPDLLKLASIKVPYKNPRELSFFTWLDLALSLDNRDAQSLLIPVVQFLLAFTFSTHESELFGHFYWMLVQRKQAALIAKLKEATSMLHSAASDPHLVQSTRTLLLLFGEIAHHASNEWLASSSSSSSKSFIPSDRSHSVQEFLVFSESRPQINFAKILALPSATATGEAALSPASSPTVVTPPGPVPMVPHGTGSASPSAALQEHGFQGESSMIMNRMGPSSSMYLLPNFAGGITQSPEGRRRSLVSLLRRSAAIIVEGRQRLVQLDNLEHQQFSRLYASKVKTCSIAIDRLHSGQPVSSGNNGNKKKKVVVTKRPPLTQASWTVFEIDSHQKAALANTRSQMQAEIDALYSRFSPGPASDEICAAISYAKASFTDGTCDPVVALKEMLSFDTTQLCSCNALRDSWIEVISEAVATARKTGYQQQVSFILLDSILSQPWTTRFLHHLMEFDSTQLVDGYTKFFASCHMLETNDALHVLRRLEATELKTDEQIAQVLKLILCFFGRRQSEAKILDHLRRGPLRLTLARHLRADEDGLCMVTRALVRGGEDGGPLPPVVWSEVSSVPDMVWQSVPMGKAREAIGDLASAFSRLVDRQALVACWISLAPNLCRRARSLDSVLAPWSAWVLSPAGSISSHPAEEEPLINCFVSCLLRLIDDSPERPQTSEILLGVLLWYNQAVCASKAPPRLVKGLSRLPWDRLYVTTTHADEIIDSFERLRAHVVHGVTGNLDDSAAMTLLMLVMEKACFEQSVDLSKCPEDLLERAFALGLNVADANRHNRLLLSLPFAKLTSEGYSAGLDVCCTNAIKACQLAQNDFDAFVTAKVEFALAVASLIEARRAMEIALIVTRFALNVFATAPISSTVAVMQFHSCMSFVRASFADFNGDLESCVVREILSFQHQESDQVFGFCFNKTLFGNSRSEFNPVGASKPTTEVLASTVTNSVGYLSVVARSFLPTFLKTDVSSVDAADDKSCESWTDDWKQLYTNLMGDSLTLALNLRRNPTLVGIGIILRQFSSGKAMSSLFVREASTMPQIQERALARLLNELAANYDLRDVAEKCESILDASLATGSAMVLCAALQRKPAGFERLASGTSLLSALDFRSAGKDAFALVSELARNLSFRDSSSLTRPYKIDRALFMSTRLEQVSQILADPKERLAAAACADAIRFCCTKADLTFSALECSGLRGKEVEWVKSHAIFVDFETLFVFVDELRASLWPNVLTYATQLTSVESRAARAGENLDDGEMVVAL